VSKNYLFISVGSGLSPCFSIYTQLLQTGNYDKIVNLFGERYLDHIPDEVCQQYSLQDPKIHNTICLSKEEIISQ
jgi:ferredoxin-NADP reductase